MSELDGSATGALQDCWFPVSTVAAMAAGQPVSVELFDGRYVAWRAKKGVIVWRDHCPHRGAQLSLGRIENDCLRCPYHGWQYDDSGQCVNIPSSTSARIPSRAHTTGHATTAEFGGLVWMCLGESPKKPRMVQFDDPQYRILGSGPHRVATSYARMCENFLDVSHLPFVHEGTIGLPEYPEVADFKVAVESGVPGVERVVITTPDFEGDSAGSPSALQYVVHSPASVSYAAGSEDGEKHSAMMLAARPVSQHETDVFFSFAKRGPVSDSELAAALQFEIDVFNQDLPVVESQSPKRLPLDRRQELHIKTDALTVAWRRYLADAGIVYGVLCGDDDPV